MKTRPALLTAVMYAALAPVSFGAAVPRALAAQATDPPYLSQFPSPERIQADVRGVDAMETAAKQAGIFWQLRQLIYGLALSQRRTDRQFTPDEQRLEVEYRNAHYRAIEPFEGKVAGADKPKWFELRGKYEMDLWLRDEVFKKYFKPELRRAVYVALKGQMPTENPPEGSTLTPSANERAAAANSTRTSSTTSSIAPPTAQPNTSASSSAKDYAAQASIYFKAKDFTKAIEFFKKAIALEPTATRYGNLGLAYFNIEQYPEAIAAFQQGIRLDPNNAVIPRNLGVTLQTAGQYRDALAVFREAQRLRPNDPDNHNLAGNAYLSLDQFPEAVVAYQEAIRLAPNNAAYRKNLGVTYLEMGKKEEALKVYHELQNIDQAKAKEFYAEFQFIESDNPQELLNLGEGTFQVEDYSSARRIFRRVIVLNKNPESVAQAYRMIGRVYKDWEKNEKAIESFEQAVAFYQKAIRLNPNKADVHFDLGSTYVEMGRKQDALQVYRTLQRLDREKAQKLLAEINKAK